MLIRPHDRLEDRATALEFLAAQGFGHLAASGEGHDVPVVVPTQFVVDGDHIVLHLAAANPVFARLEERPRGILSVAGDWAYIPGGWKAIGDEDPALGIPTTYYGAVQVIGDVTIVDGDEIAEVLRTQVRTLEPESDLADPSTHRAKFRVIRGLRLAMDDVRAKFKYGGNVDQAHREAVAARLRTRNGPGDLAAAAHVPGVTS
ncbi:MAG: FMN-binding negative transcriptional regulator [Actinomycetota bacterium]